MGLLLCFYCIPVLSVLLRLYVFCFICLTTAGPRVKVWPSKINLSAPVWPSKINLSAPVALAAVYSKAVVLLLFIHCCSHCLWGF